MWENWSTNLGTVVLRAALRAVFTVVLSSGMVGTAASQVLGELDSLTVTAAVAYGLRTHPALTSFDGQRQIVGGLRTQQTPLQSPTVAFEREGISGSDFTEQRFVFGQVVTSPLASAFARRKYERMGDVVGLHRDSRERDVTAGIQRAFLNFAYERALQGVRMEQVEVARALLETSERRELAGEVAHLDVLRSRIELVEAEASLVESSRLLAIGRKNVYYAMGLEETGGLPPVTARPMLPERRVAVDSVAVFAAVPDAPALRAAGQSIEAARFHVRETQATLFPDLTAEVFPQDLGAGFKAWGYQVGLRLHFPFSAVFRGRTQEARGMLQREQHAAREANLQFAASADSVWSHFRLAEATVRLLQARAISDASELLRLTLRGYELGEVPLVSLLDVRQSVLRVRLRHLTALREYYKRVIDLELLTGIDLTSQIL